MEIPGAIVGSVVTFLIVPISEHLGCLIFCRKYVRVMRTKKKALDATKVGAEESIKSSNTNSLRVPPEVRGWLEEVRKLDAQVESFPSEVGSCFNLKVRNKLGRKAYRIIQDIKILKKEYSRIHWPNHPVPLGQIDMTKASTCTPAAHHNDIKSREQVFMKALKALQPDHSSHMIALCGMAGVGKTKMMQNLKKVVNDEKMFDFVIEVDIGEKMEVNRIQQAVAEHLAIGLTEVTEGTRAIKLRNGFKALSDGGKSKFLVILDDVWQVLDLTVIGLSSSPNQGVNFKVLMTSRDRDVCSMMGVELDSILNVKFMDNVEAQIYFFQFITKNRVDANYRMTGNRIAVRCHGLPIAIKTIAVTLNGKSKHVWEDALSRIEARDVNEVVHRIFAMSYKNLPDEETRLTLLLCGLFPEDFNIPIKELVMFCSNMELFENLSIITNERYNRLKTCIDRLICANLLLESEREEDVKMHNLVHGFVSEVRSSDEHVVKIDRNTKTMLSWTKHLIDEKLRGRLSGANHH